jgi:hypothetical protein
MSFKKQIHNTRLCYLITGSISFGLHVLILQKTLTGFLQTGRWARVFKIFEGKEPKITKSEGICYRTFVNFHKQNRKDTTNLLFW